MGTQAVQPTTQNQCKGDVEPTRNHTKAFLGFPFAKHPDTRERKSSTLKYAITLTYLKQHVEDTEFQTGKLVLIEIPIYPFLLKHQNTIYIHGYEIVATNVKKGDHTTILSLSFFRPVSFRKATIKGHTPTILATTSTSSGIARQLVKMAFFSAGREAIQSRLSAPFNLFTMNSVMEYGFRVPKTLDAVF